MNFNKSSSSRPNPPKKNKTKYLGSGESHHQNKSSSRIEWIDRLLQIPIEIKENTACGELLVHTY